MSFRSIIHDMVIDMHETRLNTVAQLRAFLEGRITRPRSQSDQVQGLTPSFRAAVFCVQPSSRRLAFSRSAIVVGAWSGLYPKNRITAGMDFTGGQVRPFSQCKTVRSVTPSRSAASFWERPSTSRCFLTCCPIVWVLVRQH
jgi:hypothetical protein